MPKTNAFSRDNGNNSLGFLDLHLTWLNQPLLTTSNPLFNSLTTTSDVVIGGNLTVNGTSTIISAEVVEIQDNIILLNAEESGSGIALNLSGVEVERGTLPNFQAVFEESSTLYKIGEVGNLQAVATREDLPLSKGVMVYNQALRRLDSVTDIELPITLSAGVNPVSSSTGTLIVPGGGGIAATGDIYTDSRLFIKGSVYTTYIDCNSSDELIVNPGTNFIFQQLPNSEIKVPTDVSITFSSVGNKIFSSGTDFSLQNTIGDTYISTIANGSVIVPTGTYIQWTPTNRIRYDSTDIVLDSSGSFKINPRVVSTLTTASISSTTGSVSIAGGIGLSNTTDASSVTNGGTITTAGGAAIAKKLFVGDRVDISTTGTSQPQVINQGINFRSRNRTLVTSSNTDTVFNSFEGGLINITSGTVGNAATLFINDAPGISGGGVLTNSYALWVNSGMSRFDARMTITNTTVSTNSFVGALTVAGGIGVSNTLDSVSSANGGALCIGGGGSIAKTLFVGAKVDIGDSAVTVGTHAPAQGVNFRSRNRTITTSGTNDIAINSFGGGTVNNASVMTNGSTVYIAGAPTVTGGGSLTKTYALWVNSGNTRLDGVVLVNDSSPSTSSTTGAVTLVGGVGIDNATDAVSVTNGGTLTTAGGAAIAKKLFVGNTVSCNAGTDIPYFRMSSLSSSRFTMGLITAEIGGDSGSDFAITRYTDAGVLVDNPITIKRSTGHVTITSSTGSTSSSVGALKLQGGLSLSNTTNALSTTNGGTITTAGGAAIAKDLYIGGDTYVTGTTNLAKTNINTNTGKFNVTGNNGVDMIVGDTSTFRTTTGGLTLQSSLGTVVVDGSSGVTMDSASGISLDAGGVSNFSTSSGAMTVEGVGLNLKGTSGGVNLNSTGIVNLNSVTGGIVIDTTSSNGVKIGVDNVVPIFIGNGAAEVTVGNNLTIGGDLTVLGSTTSINSTVTTISDNSIVINSMPTGLSDGGYLIKRYQPPNDSGSGQVVLDTPTESGTFQAGNALPGTLILDSGASSILDYYIGWWIKITTGAGAGQVRRIKSYDGSTKEATLYETSDNTATFTDGSDLTTAPAAGDTYTLHNCTFSSMYYSENAKEIRFACLPVDISSGTFAEPAMYLPIHADSLVLDGSFTSGSDTTINGILTVSKTDTRAFIVEKGSGGDVFTVDTALGNVVMSNPVNTIGSDTTLLFNQYDSVNSVKTYSQINSVVQNNVSGNLRSSLDFNVQKDIFGLTNFMSIRGNVAGASYVDFSTSVDAVRIINSVETTSPATGSLRISGGVGINNSTDAVSVTNGGTITTAGGAAIAKKLFVGGVTTLTDSTKVSTTTNSITSGALNINGDMVLGNGTQNTILFNTSGVAAPSFTNRSLGTKLMLFPNLSGTTVDYAIGMESDAVWYSASGVTSSHKFYLGTNEKLRINSNGITLQNNQDGISFYNPGTTNTAKIYQETDVLRVVPHSQAGIAFRNSSDSVDTVTIDENGKTIVGLSDFQGAPETKGTLFRTESLTFTDDSTAASTTVSRNVLVSFEQSSIAATNTSVTTSDAINVLLSGSPIKGTNQTFTNAYNLYVSKGISLTPSGIIDNAASLYIEDSPLGNVTNAYSLWVNSGNSRIDGKTDFTNTTQISVTSNSVTSLNSSVTVNGDLGLYNSTKNTIFFRATIDGAPVYTNRSIGTKLVLSPSISSSSTDYAIGVESGATWYSVPSSSESHKFYVGNSPRASITDEGILLDSPTQTSVIKMNTSDTADNKGLILKGSGGGDHTRGAQLQLYGNELNFGDAILSAGETGNIKFQTNSSNDSLVILSSGQVSIKSTQETSGTGTGALRVDGGASITKSIVACTESGSSFTLDFPQKYIYSSDILGTLNVKAGSSSNSFVQRHFTNDGDGTDSNVIEFYGLGTVDNITNSESLRIGHESSSYHLKTQASGTGVMKSLTLESGSSEIVLNPTGTVNYTSTIASTNLSTASVVFAGGISISNSTNATSSTNGGSVTTNGGMAVAKKLFVGEDLSVTGTITAGVSSPSVVLSNNVNVDGLVTALNSKLISNGVTRTLSIIFRLTPTASNIPVKFDFTVPGITSFSNIYDVVYSVNGFQNDSAPVNIENKMAYAQVGTNRSTVSITAGSTDIHTIQIVAVYSV